MLCYNINGEEKGRNWASEKDEWRNWAHSEMPDKQVIPQSSAR